MPKAHVNDLQTDTRPGMEQVGSSHVRDFGGITKFLSTVGPEKFGLLLTIGPANCTSAEAPDPIIPLPVQVRNQKL